jgi:hypothetical protein
MSPRADWQRVIDVSEARSVFIFRVKKSSMTLLAMLDTEVESSRVLRNVGN